MADLTSIVSSMTTILTRQLYLCRNMSPPIYYAKGKILPQTVHWHDFDLEPRTYLMMSMTPALCPLPQCGEHLKLFENPSKCYRVDMKYCYVTVEPIVRL